MKKTHALITGITGFAGWHLYSLLSKNDNYEIVGIHKAGSGSERFSNVKIIKCSVTDSDALEDVIKEIMPDCIYHLAAYVHVGRTEVNPTDLFQTNMIGTLNLLNAVKKYVPKSRTVIVGSAEEYGFIPQEKMPIKESFELANIVVYSENGAEYIFVEGKKVAIVPENFKMIVPKGGLKGYESH